MKGVISIEDVFKEFAQYAPQLARKPPPALHKKN